MHLTMKLAFENIKSEKKRSLLITFLYFISAVFFVTEALSAYNFYLTDLRRLDNTYGVHDGIFLCDKIDALNRIKAMPEISETGVITVKALAVRNEDYSERRIVLGTADDYAIKLNRISLLQGEFPVLSDEIALEESFLNFTYPNARIGDKIQMKLNSPYSKEITLTLSGVINDISNLQWNTENGKPPMINGLVSSDFMTDTALYGFVSIKYAEKEASLSNFSLSLLQKDGVLFYLENQRSSLDSFGIISQNGKIGIILLITFLLIFTIIVLLAISCIYKRGNARTIGLMKTSGFSVNYIKLFFIIKSLILIFPSVISGIFSGLMLSVFISDRATGFYALDKAWLIMLVCFVITLLILILSLILSVNKECKKSVVENLRIYEADSKIVQNIKLKTDNPVLLYAIKAFAFNGKEIASICVMTFLSAIISFIGIFAYSEIKRIAEENSPAYDFSLAFPEQYVTLLSTYENNYLGITDNEYKALKSNGDVKDIMGVKTIRMYELTKDKTDYKNEAMGDVEEFIKLKDFFGFPKDYYISSMPLHGVDDDILEELKKYVVEGEIDINALSGGKEVILCKTENNSAYKYAVGDTIKLANVLNMNPDAVDINEMSFFETEVKVGALVEYKNDSESRVMRRELCGMVWSESAFYKVFGFKLNYRHVYITVCDKNYYPSLSNMINELNLVYGNSKIEKNQSIFVDNGLQRSKSFEQAYTSFVTISLTIASGLALFSLISVISAIITKLMKRRKIFGFLRAVGLCEKQMLQMLLTENIASIFISFFLGAICGFGLCAIINSSASSLTLPLLFMPVFFLAYVPIIVTACFVITNKYFKVGIIEHIRYGE